jgi:hypothetical protein
MMRPCQLTLCCFVARTVPAQEKKPGRKAIDSAFSTLGWIKFPKHYKSYVLTDENHFIIIMFVINLFELCWRTQQPSLTFCRVGGSMFCLWPLFYLRDGGKWTEMTATQHRGTLRHYFLHYITIQIMLGFFHYFFIFMMLLFFLCDLLSPSTGCKSQLF